jgi:UTP--glucose-1-phosphate uridylyltransferase
MRVRTAVIPAAGLGTRFLPATKAVPKELLPIIDVPALQLVVDEITGAGLDHVVLVSSRQKPAIEAYFEPAGWVVDKVASSGRPELAERLASIGRDVEVSVCYQDEPRGLGHAVGCARELVGDEPFAVLLPDELMGSPALLASMARICGETGTNVVALKQVPREAVSAYGVVDPAGPIDADGVVLVRDVVEKPPVAEAPSELIIIGRYVLTPDVFDDIAQLKPGAVGELQLTDALRAQAARTPWRGLVSDVRRHDTGTPLGWLCAVVELALEHPGVGPGFRSWLADHPLGSGPRK